MKFVVLLGLGGILVGYFALVVAGYFVTDEMLEPPHPERCDCMACGRKAVKRELNGVR